MRRAGRAVLLAAGLVLAGCGGQSGTSEVGGGGAGSGGGGRHPPHAGPEPYSS